MNVPNRVPWINIAVGIMAIISPFVTNSLMGGSARWAIIIPGIVIAVVAIIEMSVYGRSQNMSYWPVINILAGVWLFIATTFMHGNAAMIWSDIVLGVAAIMTALVTLSYERVHASIPNTTQRV